MTGSKSTNCLTASAPQLAEIAVYGTFINELSVNGKSNISGIAGEVGNFGVLLHLPCKLQFLIIESVEDYD